MAQSIIGKDVTAYLIQAGGVDTGGTPTAGAAYTALGKWETVEFSFTTKWFETTPSDGTIETRRAGPNDWKATLSNMVRNDIGSLSLLVGLNNNFIYFSFTERETGKSLSCTGGISEANFTANAEAWKDKFEILNVGYAPTYA